MSQELIGLDRVIGAFAMQGLEYASAPLVFLAYVMTRRREIGSFEALLDAFLVLVVELFLSGVAKPPPEPAGPWTLVSVFGLLLVPGGGAAAAYGLMRLNARRRTK